MKLDNDTKDIMRSLIITGHFVPRTRSLNISKFLDEDNTIDLWLLEVAVRNLVVFMNHATGWHGQTVIAISGKIEYITIRGLLYEHERATSELRFVRSFIDSITKDALY